jgi:hypothetical protein
VANQWYCCLCNNIKITPKWNNNDLKGKYWIQLHDIFSMLTEYPCISMFLSFYIVFKHPCFDERKPHRCFMERMCGLCIIRMMLIIRWKINESEHKNILMHGYSVSIEKMSCNWIQYLPFRSLLFHLGVIFSLLLLVVGFTTT